MFLKFKFQYFAIFLAICMLLATSSYLFINSQIKIKLIDDKETILLIKKGDNVSTIASNLKQMDIVKNDFITYLVLKFYLLNPSKIKVGEYHIFPSDNLLKIADRISEGKMTFRKITFVEGYTVHDYVAQINNTPGLTGNITESLEDGYLMPETYLYSYGDTKDSIIRKMKTDMMAFVGSLWEKHAENRDFYLKDINEVLTLASVVEKETGIKSEMRLIAGVFQNRLAKGIKLQSDPTTIYEITRGMYKMDRNLTYNDLKTKGDYNTYYTPGLPIKPIANPSKDAILAVFHPTKTKHLFFVADNKGGHNFSEDFDGHRKNIAVYKAGQADKIKMNVENELADDEK